MILNAYSFGDIPGKALDYSNRKGYGKWQCMLIEFSNMEVPCVEVTGWKGKANEVASRINRSANKMHLPVHAISRCDRVFLYNEDEFRKYTEELEVG